MNTPTPLLFEQCFKDKFFNRRIVEITVRFHRPYRCWWLIALTTLSEAFAENFFRGAKRRLGNLPKQLFTGFIVTKLAWMQNLSLSQPGGISAWA